MPKKKKIRKRVQEGGGPSADGLASASFMWTLASKLFNSQMVSRQGGGERDPLVTHPNVCWRSWELRKSLFKFVRQRQFSSDFLSLFFSSFFLETIRRWAEGFAHSCVCSCASHPGDLIRAALGRHPAADNEARSRGRRSPGHSGKKKAVSPAFHLAPSSNQPTCL